jgi:hypothetical protein
MDNPTDDRQPFTKDTLMGDAMAHAPNLPVVLMQFHIGGCNMCGFENEDTIAKVAVDNGVPVDRLLEAINSRP